MTNKQKPHEISKYFRSSFMKSRFILFSLWKIWVSHLIYIQYDGDTVRFREISLLFLKIISAGKQSVSQ